MSTAKNTLWSTAALAVAGLMLAGGFTALPQAPVAEPPQQRTQLAHYHHLHFNSVDPAAAIESYTTRFNGEKTKFGESDAVRTGKSWLLFERVTQPPLAEIVAPIYHLGWGAEDIKSAYQHQLDIGTKFETPLSDLADLLGTGTPGRGYYAYVDGPDHALIEMNGANHHNFQHVHLLSDDPLAAAEWYMREFGIPRRGPPPSGEPRFNAHGLQTGPAVFLLIDGVLFAWFPAGTAKGLYPKQWEGRTKLASNRGRVIDHFAFSVENLEETLTRLRKDNVKVTAPPRLIPRSTVKSAFIEGPDGLEIELVEE
jgi:catechol 2,3-dioxygenase-like lactoylglutathione lyase family enzyme